MFQLPTVGWMGLLNIQDFWMNYEQYINTITMVTQIKECSWEVLLKYETLLKCPGFDYIRLKYLKYHLVSSCPWKSKFCWGTESSRFHTLTFNSFKVELS